MKKILLALCMLPLFCGCSNFVGSKTGSFSLSYSVVESITCRVSK